MISSTKTFLQLILLGILAPTIANADQRPNFILIIADDMAADDCGPMGHPKIQTPNLDRLASEGLVFEQAFLTCSSCSPSRSSIITSKYPHQTNAEQLHWPLPADQVTFPELLKQAGYYTAASGKWHLGQAARRGFDLVQDTGSAAFQLPSGDRADSSVMIDDKNSSGAAGWVETLRGVPEDRPFFLWLAALDPHRDYQPGIIRRPHQADDVIVPPFLPDTPEVRSDLALYYDEITRLDSYVGAVLDQLEKQGRASNTYVIFISDNGRPFPRCKTTVLDSGIQTPMLIRTPQSEIAGQRTSALVSTVDIGPTLLELAGVSPDPAMMGKSLTQVLKDPSSPHRDVIFAEHNWHDYNAYQRALRSRNFKYIRNFDYDLTLSPPADAVRSPTFQAMRTLRDQGKLSDAQMQCFVVPRTPEELYDLEADPYELNNLASDPEYDSLLGEYRQQLIAWRRTTYDAALTIRSEDEFDRETGTTLPNRVRPRVGKDDGFRPMFTTPDLAGWVRTNTHPSTWTLADGVLKCTGKPIGELRTDKMYQNFVLELEWRHLVPGGNAGIFVWADDITAPGVPFHRGIEVQVLENDYGNTDSHTTHGDIFPIHGATMVPINGRGGQRAFPTQLLSKPAPEWNHYRIVCNDGEISLSVNGQVVTRGEQCAPKKGYICVESEGGVVEYRNVRIKELPNTPIQPQEIAIADRGLMALYQGIDLEGWAINNPDAWSINDWVLSYRGSEPGAISTTKEFATGRFVIDAKRNSPAASYQIGLAGLVIDSGDDKFSPPGTWDRIEIELDGDQFKYWLNGELQNSIGRSETKPLTLTATGDVDFTNIYGPRKIDN